MAGSNDDMDLVERYVRGQRSAFDQIVHRHQGRVAELAYRLLGWDDEVDDAVQDVFLSALKGLDKFRGDANLSTWLTRITINTCRRRRRRRFLRLGFVWKHRGSSEAGEEVAVDQRVMKRETFEAVRRAVRGLPMRYREVIVLRYLEDMPTAEIAEVLGLSQNAVGVRLHRAREQLKRQLAPIVEEPFDERRRD